ADTPAPPSTHRRDLDPRLDALCLRAMAHKPQDRFAGMADFAQALASLPTPSSSTTVDARTAEPSAPTAPTQPIGPDPRLAPRILEMLRRWGWARAVQKMRNKAQRTETEAHRVGWQGFLDWMAGERSQES